MGRGALPKRFRAALDAVPEVCDGGPELWSQGMCLQNEGSYVEGWKEAVKAGEILLFDEARAEVMRYAPGGGRGRGRGGGSRSARWRGKRRGGRRGGWDDGDGLLASTTVLADSTVPPIVPTSMRTTAPSKGPSQAVPLLVPVSNLCAVLCRALYVCVERLTTVRLGLDTNAV